MMFFLDGVGIGKEDPSINPFFAARLPVLRSLLQGRLPSLRNPSLSTSDVSLLSLDATLGVDGLPQSGTGQTALFTGTNSARAIGRHHGPFPHSSQRTLIANDNLFRKITDFGLSPYFANAFPQRFFDYVARHQFRLTVTTLSCVLSNVRLRTVDDLAIGRGVSADITNAAWPSLGHPNVDSITPREAGRRLTSLLGENHFVLFEYWYTDRAGHSQNMGEAIDSLQRFDALLEGVVETLDVRSTLLLITSDHGNIEDLTTKTHTRNPVPLLLYGLGHSEFAHLVNMPRPSPPDLTTVAPALLRFLSSANS